MKVNRRSLVTLALVAIVGVGLVGAYHASAGDCCKAKGEVKKASAGKGECAYSKAACESAKKAGAKGSDCCAAKGAAQASAGSSYDVIPVGAGGCPHGSMKTSGASCSAKGVGAGASCAFADNCDGCKLFKSHWTSLESASREVVRLPDGILVHMTSDDPTVVADIQKYAQEKAEMMRSISNKTFTGKLCSFCQERTRSVQGASYRVANADNGVYSVITAGAPETVVQLHKIAEAETATKTSVSG